MSERARASQLEWVRIGDMTVSPKAQREFRKAHAEMIAAEPHLIKGAALVCQRYDGSLKDDAAAAKLGQLPGPSALTRRAAALQLKTGHQQHHCAAAAIVDTLNTGRGGMKLESWWR